MRRPIKRTRKHSPTRKRLVKRSSKRATKSRSPVARKTSKAPRGKIRRLRVPRKIANRAPCYDLKSGADRRELYEQVESDYSKTFKRVGPRKGSALRVEVVTRVKKKKGKFSVEKRVFRDLETFEKFLVARYHGERQIDWESFDEDTKIRLVWRSKLQRHAKPVYHYHYRICE